MYSWRTAACRHCTTWATARGRCYWTTPRPATASGTWRASPDSCTGQSWPWTPGKVVTMPPSAPTRATCTWRWPPARLCSPGPSPLTLRELRSSTGTWLTVGAARLFWWFGGFVTDMLSGFKNIYIYRPTGGFFLNSILVDFLTIWYTSGFLNKYRPTGDFFKTNILVDCFNN